jgi:hypothetical protein
MEVRSLWLHCPCCVCKPLNDLIFNAEDSIYISRSCVAAEWWIKIFRAKQRPCVVVKQVFQSMIFKLPVLKHTCYVGYRYQWSDGYEDYEGEIAEIHAEQAASYVLLETLIELALSQWINETRSFSEFIEEFVET